MSGTTSGQRIIPLEEGWNDEIKAKVGTAQIWILRTELEIFVGLVIIELW